jgi:hypothetical protein
MPTYTPTSHAGATDTYEYAITFAFARTTDVKVYIDDEEIDLGTDDDQWTLSADGLKVVFVDGWEPKDGETLIIKRVTDISSAIVDWTAGSGFTEVDADNMVLQLLYSIDELQVPAFERTYTLAALEAAGVADYHVLGAVPTRFSYHLICTTGDLNYIAGNVVDLNQADNLPPVYWTPTLLITDKDGWDALTLPHASTGAHGAIDPNDWSLIVRAWR